MFGGAGASRPGGPRSEFFGQERRDFIVVERSRSSHPASIYEKMISEIMRAARSVRASCAGDLMRYSPGSVRPPRAPWAAPATSAIIRGAPCAHHRLTALRMSLTKPTAKTRTSTTSMKTSIIPLHTPLLSKNTPAVTQASPYPSRFSELTSTRGEALSEFFSKPCTTALLASPRR